MCPGQETANCGRVAGPLESVSRSDNHLSTRRTVIQLAPPVALGVAEHDDKIDLTNLTDIRRRQREPDCRLAISARRGLSFFHRPEVWRDHVEVADRGFVEGNGQCGGTVACDRWRRFEL